MATWNIGPFDNDDAVEWCERLESTEPGRRLDMVRSALEQAAHHRGHVPPDTAARAIAATATVLQALTGTQPSNSPYAPRFLLGREDIGATRDIRELAVKALDAATAEDSPWHSRWTRDVEAAEAFELVSGLRAEITAHDR